MELVKRLSFVFIKLLIIYLIIGLMYIVYGLNIKLDKYNIKNDEFNGKIEVTYSNNSDSFISDKKNNNVQKFIACYEYPIKEENFTNEMKNKLNELYDLFKNSEYSVSFAYEDMYTGLHISYNENQTFFTASTIKAPVEVYLYEQVDNGKLNLDSMVTYTSNFYLEGSGSIQYQTIGTQYKLRDLVKMALVESDNIAYQMTASQVNYNEIKNFWKEKGANNFWTNGYWGNTSAHDGIIYMKELYNYSLNNSDLSNELLDYLYNSVFKLIKGKNENIMVAHKSGWHFEILHDTALIFDDYPYTLAINTNMSYGDYSNFFNQASKLISEFHDLYWKNKANICYDQVF